jgi:hypothetical protein
MLVIYMKKDWEEKDSLPITSAKSRVLIASGSVGFRLKFDVTKTSHRSSICASMINLSGLLQKHQKYPCGEVYLLRLLQSTYLLANVKKYLACLNFWRYFGLS